MEVEQDEAGCFGRAMADRSQQVQSFETVLGRDGVKPFTAQQRDEHFSGVGVVFDDEHVTG